MRNAISLLLLLCIGCATNPAAEHSDTIMQAEADAVVALAFATSIEHAEPAPTPKPDGRKVTCPSCDGDGRSGDGLGKCGTCGGEGKVVVESAAIVDPPKDEVKSITLYMNESNYNKWPLKWYREERVKMNAAGFTTQFERDRNDKSDTEAYFIIRRGDNETKVVGFHTAQQLLLK